MAIRNLHQGWAALVVGVLFLSGSGQFLHADDDDCDECSDQSRWQRFCTWCTSDHGCKNRCRRCHRSRSACRCYRQVGAGSFYGPGGYNGFGPYSDSRDTALYSTQGYGVPIAVPLAPVVQRTYNYGWGVPSSRLTRVGARYNQWYPGTPYSQTAGQLPGDTYPTIYQPTDSTQQGYYYVHAPRWGRYTY